MTAIIQKSIGTHLCWRQVVGYMDRRFREAQFPRCQQAGVTADDHAVLVNDDRHPPAKFLDGGRYFVDRLGGNLTRVAGKRNDLLKRPNRYLHRQYSFLLVLSLFNSQKSLELHLSHTSSLKISPSSMRKRIKISDPCVS